MDATNSTVVQHAPADMSGMTVLKGKKAIILGIANKDSIAYGCALAFRRAGAQIAITYLNEKAKPHVEPIAQELEAEMFLPCDVRNPGELKTVFEEVEKRWGQLDIALHSIAFAPKQDLHGGLLDSSKEGFSEAMDISCHSFIRMAKYAAPLMKNGGAMFTMTYLGSERVVPHYNLMGPVKAALEASVRYLAAELGPKQIRVHAISPGPLRTRAASGIKDFQELIDMTIERAPAHSLVDIHDVGATTAFLATDFARLMTGSVVYVDGGYNIMG